MLLKKASHTPPTSPLAAHFIIYPAREEVDALVALGVEDAVHHLAQASGLESAAQADSQTSTRARIMHPENLQLFAVTALVGNGISSLITTGLV